MTRDPGPPQRSRNLRGRSGVSCFVFANLALLAAGCLPMGTAPKSDLGAYPFAQIAPASVDNEVHFYEERVKTHPNSAIEETSLAQAYLNKAQTSAKFEYYGLAEKAAKEALRLHPDYNQAELIVAALKEARHDFQGSYDITNKLYEADSNDVGAKSLLTNSMLELGHLQDAHAVATSIMRQWPTSSTMALVARCLILEGKDDQATQLLMEALKKEQADEKKSSARIRSLLGDMYLREGRDDDARHWFDASLSVTRNNFPALLGLARLEGRLGHWDWMERLYTEAFSYTQNPAYLTEMSYAQAKQGNQEEAKNNLNNADQLLRKVLTQGEYGHGRDLTRVLLIKNQPKEALTILEKEHKQRNDWKLKEVLGTTEGRLGHWKEALESYQAAIDTGLREPVLYELAAQAAEQLKDTAAAARLRQQAKAINPNFKPEWVEF